MLNYFPYSTLINTVSNIKSCVSRHPYFGEWTVGISDSIAIDRNETAYAISEIYY